MRITFFETNEADEQVLEAELKSAGLSGIEANYVREPLTEATAERAAGSGAVSVFVHSAVTRTVLDRLPDLGLVLTRSTGYDHVDLGAAKKRGITVCNVPSYGSRTVAEFTFSLILGLSRRTFEAYRRVKDDADFDMDHFEGFDLFGKTLGVVGTGRIGQNVARIAKGFGMSVLAYDAYPNAAAAGEIGYAYAATLHELLGQADIVTLHVPASKDTRHLMNDAAFREMKAGAILINTARGDVVDTDALVRALGSGKLRAAGLDVFEHEQSLGREASMASEEQPLEAVRTALENRLLVDLPNVAATPHVAFNSREAKAEIAKMTLKNLAAFIGGTPLNAVS